MSPSTHPISRHSASSRAIGTVGSSRRRHAGQLALLETLEVRTLCSFSAPIASPGGGNGLAVGDINNDGKSDVVVFGAKDKLVVSLSNGDGTFRQVATLNGLTGDPWMINAIADLNGDGRVDLRAWGFKTAWNARGAKSTGAVSPQGACLQGTCGGGGGGSGYTVTVYETVWLGNGNGTFGPGTTRSFGWPYGAPTEPSNPTTADADFNRDGIVDRAYIPYWETTRAAYLLIGTADGSYQPRQNLVVGPNPLSIATGDFNGDGWADLIVVNSLSGGKFQFSVLLNNKLW